ncbi:unnamed protein product [Lampetra planeri]
MGTRVEGARETPGETSRRVFVGGLVASVRPEELRRRFEAFGAVGDVAVKTRSDETGTPIKTFAYVNLQASDAELRKCFSVLNHTKWKGVPCSWSSPRRASCSGWRRSERNARWRRRRRWGPRGVGAQ